MIRAVVILLEREGKIIFVKRSLLKKSLPGMWSLCSGMVEEGEGVFETAKREAMEELGLRLYDLELYDEQEIKKEGEHKRLYFVKAKYFGEPRIVDKREFSEIRGYSFSEFFRIFPDKEIGHGLQYLRGKLNN